MWLYLTGHINEAIFTLARMDELHVELVVPVEFYGRFTLGQTLKVFPQKPIGGEYAGKIIVIDPVVDAGSGTFGIRVLLANPENKIPAGIRCTVDLKKKN
ncbi:efflux RND transporter periplasmic adaptor subunit [sulfur-oxidizing endosymbiont of Gigantopelta aegis]|uniref:efflux RND transporter periplasmic adaptor subunit n=1 Tax=sulfur-oxidizing endosymbiont of Gigantopelta aegis TaxID=2794934 RepID=UPI0018DEC740|nr:efflux RND transporter periplasmic adaptor subunit [sulfur-oxidizing endosymbiont of Gigantopelta aegis]